MSTNSAKSTNNPLFKRIRLLRKKLKQIETLKLLSKKLNDEEHTKIARQDEFRDELLDLLTERAERAQEETLAQSAAEELTDDSEDERPPSSSESDDSSKGGGDRPPKSSTSAPETPKAAVVPPDGDSPQSKPSAEQTKSKKAAIKSDTAKPVDVDPLKNKRKTWSNKYFDLTELTGHTDIIRSVDINADYIVSASRDTTVKLWKTSSGELIHNFGGHRDQVNCVKLIQLPGVSSKTLVVSGSEDCSIRFWDTKSGSQMKEFYVYNSVTSFALLDSGQYLAAGLDGGKLQLYSLHSLTYHCSHSLMTDRVTCLASHGSMLAVGGSDGLVNVLELNDKTLKCMYALEEELMGCVKSLVLLDEHVILGDDMANVKLIHWKQNRVTAIANHHSEFGVTDALYTVGGCLLSSAYDYDSGVGFVNVRDASQQRFDYLTSLADPDVLHILNMAALEGGDHSSALTVVTGGMELVMWKEDVTRSVDSVRCKTRKLLLADDQLHSESSDDYDDSSEVTESDSDEQEPNEGGWWCALL